MEDVTSGTHGDTPHTSKSPLLLRSLASASRRSRLPATRKTAILPLIVMLQGDPSVRDPSSLVTRQCFAYPCSTGKCMTLCIYCKDVNFTLLSQRKCAAFIRKGE